MGVVPEEEHGNHSDDLSRTVQRGARVTTGRGPAAGAEGLGRQLNQSFLVLSFPLRYSWFPEGEPAKCSSTRQALSQLDLCRRKSQPGRYSIPPPSLVSFRHRSLYRRPLLLANELVPKQHPAGEFGYFPMHDMRLFDRLSRW